MNLGQFIGIRLLEKETTPIEQITHVTRQHFAELGRAGGLKGGIARAQALAPERRSEIARMGGIARREKLKSQG